MNLYFVQLPMGCYGETYYVVVRADNISEANAKAANKADQFGRDYTKVPHDTGNFPGQQLVFDDNGCSQVIIHQW